MIPVEITWCGGRHSFALGLKEVDELQECCNAGAEYILNQLRFNLHSGGYRQEDFIHPVRLGLIGGNPDLDRVEAEMLVEKMVYRHGQKQVVLCAILVLERLVHGPADDMPDIPDDLKKQPGDPAETIPEESGSSPQSTASADS